MLQTDSARRLRLQAGGAAVAGWATVACAVHCVLTPVVVSVIPGLGLPESVEWGMLAVSGLFAAWSTRVVDDHRRARAVAAGAGLLIWSASLAGWLEPTPETVGSAVGAVLVAVSLLHAAHCCRSRNCDVCGDGEA